MEWKILINFNDLYAYGQPNFGQPEKIGSYKLDQDQNSVDFQYENDKNPDKTIQLKTSAAKPINMTQTFPSLKSKKPPRKHYQNKHLYPFEVKYLEKPFNLPFGYNWVAKPNRQNILPGYPTARYSGLLQWKEGLNKHEQNNKKYDFSANRNILNNVISGFVSRKLGYTNCDSFGAVLKNGTIHLYNVSTWRLFEDESGEGDPSQVPPQRDDRDHTQKSTQKPVKKPKNFGYSFEEFIKSTNQKTILNSNNEDLNIFQNTIGNFSILYVAEMDYSSQNTQENENFGPGLEFKTCIDIHDQNMSEKFILKSQKYRVVLD